MAEKNRKKIRELNDRYTALITMQSSLNTLAASGFFSDEYNMLLRNAALEIREVSINVLEELTKEE